MNSETDISTLRNLDKLLKAKEISATIFQKFIASSKYWRLELKVQHLDSPLRTTSIFAMLKLNIVL